MKKMSKAEMLKAITTANPMHDNYHTGIRELSDILTAEEAVAEGEGFCPDVTAKTWADALASGFITVYSSKPFRVGSFVTPSPMMAKDYAGSGHIYSGVMPLDSIGWIDAGEGQIATLN